MPIPSEILDKLDELLVAIRAYDDPRRATAEWKQAFNQLKKTDADANRVANVIAMRGVERLAELIETLRAPSPGPEAEGEIPDDATCRAAMRAFRKRLKLTRLDDESQINSRNPLTNGRPSQIDIIMPPVEFPQRVWEELVGRGELRNAGRGFYQLP